MRYITILLYIRYNYEFVLMKGIETFSLSFFGKRNIKSFLTLLIHTKSPTKVSEFLKSGLTVSYEQFLVNKWVTQTDSIVLVSIATIWAAADSMLNMSQIWTQKMYGDGGLSKIPSTSMKTIY